MEITSIDPIDLLNDFSVASHRRLDLSDRDAARHYQDQYNAAKAEILRRLNPDLHPRPTRAQAMAAVEDLDRANRAIAPVIRWKVGGGTHPIFADYERKKAALITIIEALTEVDGNG